MQDKRTSRKRAVACAVALGSVFTLTHAFVPIGSVRPSVHAPTGVVRRADGELSSKYKVRIVNPTLANLRVVPESDCCSQDGLRFDSVPPFSWRDLEGSVVRGKCKGGSRHTSGGSPSGRGHGPATEEYNYSGYQC